MELETITREEFDKRLDASNERLRQQVETIQQEQEKMERLLAFYEGELKDIEAELNSEDKTRLYSTLLRQRLHQLAEKTAQVAALV